MLAVASGEADENAQYLGCPLGRHDSTGLAQCCFIKWPGRRAADCTIVIDQLRFQLLAYINPCILNQRRKIIGAGANQGVLKINQPNPVNAAGLINPDHVGGMEITQNQRLLHRLQLIDQAVPNGHKTSQFLLSQVTAKSVRCIPLAQQIDLNQHCLPVKLRHLVCLSTGKPAR